MNNSLVKNRFSKKYKELISYTTKSFWLEKQTHHIIAFNGQKWEHLIWIIKLDSNDQVIKQKIRRKTLNNRKFETLLDFLDNHNFWSFDQDSLNLIEQNNADGSTTLFHISDGSTDEFEVISSNNQRVISAYSVEYFQKKLPTIQRQHFIECRNRFWEILGKKY